MALYPKLPNTLNFQLGNESVTLHAFNAKEQQQSLAEQAVNIIASGPSVAKIDLLALQNTATIFVNGSISLTTQHAFKNMVGYVISDARFVYHKPEILKKYYKGQPLYATLAVFEALAETQPLLMQRYHKAMRILYPVDSPWGVKSNQDIGSKLCSKYPWLNKKSPLTGFSNNDNFVILKQHQSTPIGVSLDLTHGFVEAGTVTYVATQLAFARNAGSIHLYGLDLLNNNQPRFYEKTDNSAPSKLHEVTHNRIVPSFNLLGKVYKAQGVPVINHSHISKHIFSNLN